jgi:hypothetical protein
MRFEDLINKSVEVETLVGKGLKRDTAEKLSKMKEDELDLQRPGDITSIPCWVFTVSPEGNLQLSCAVSGFPNEPRICHITALPEQKKASVYVSGKGGMVRKVLSPDVLESLSVKGFPRLSDVDVWFLKEASVGCVEQLIEKQRKMQKKAANKKTTNYTISPEKRMGFGSGRDPWER